MKQLLPNEYTRELELMPVIIGKIIDKSKLKLINDYLYNQNYAQKDELSHLKRIHKQDKSDNMQVLICIAEVALIFLIDSIMTK